MNLKNICIFLGIPYIGKSIELKDIKIDSRDIKPGDLFIGVAGTKYDGRNFVNQAFQKGAAAALLEHTNYKLEIPIIYVPKLKKIMPALAAFYYGCPSKNVNVIGITGTNGKTSISYYLAQLFAAHNINCGIMGTLGNGNINNYYLSKNFLTTSDSCTIQQQLSYFFNNNVKYIAMEVSSHALDQHRVDCVEFSTAVFTNLSSDHLDYHGNIENYFSTKKKLFSYFNPSRKVINIDDIFGMCLLNNYSGLSYSLINSSADVYAAENKIYTPWGNRTINNPLPGNFNLSNILACISICGLYNLKFDLVLDSIDKLQLAPGRMQIISYDKDHPLVIVDYAHNPDALRNALESLLIYLNPDIGKIYCIFGCGGERDRDKRPLMLEVALQYSHYVIVTQDNPRAEDPKRIFKDILSLQKKEDNKIKIIHDRLQAIQNTIINANPEDIILIAGKGHEDFQIIGVDKIYFSDKHVAQKSLTMRGKYL